MTLYSNLHSIHYTSHGLAK